jgi:hypothetical protein
MIKLENIQANFKQLLEAAIDATVLLDLEYSVIDAIRPSRHFLASRNRK